MLEFACDLRVIEAIDLGMEWRVSWAPNQVPADVVAHSWYSGFLGDHRPYPIARPVGLFIWPNNHPYSCSMRRMYK